MKAEKTTELIELSIAMNTGNVPYDPKRLHDLCFEAEDELNHLEDLATKGLRAEQAEREIEVEIKSHTERGDYADRAGDKEESQRLWDMVAGLYIALDKVTGESADILKGVE